MNCHKNNNDKNTQSNHKHSPLKHMIHMVLCCGLPIVIIAILPLITKFNPAAGGVLLKIVPFLCPIMMITMMPMMIRTDKKNSSVSCKDNEAAELKKPAE
ncbi:MAG: hypothetical protein ABRQ27_07230 [Clostridiaceae bacterium]